MSFPHYRTVADCGLEWIGAIPVHWQVRKFRHCFKESSEKIEAEVIGQMLSVSGYRGIEVKDYDDENRRRLDEDLIGYRVVRVGQLVVNTMWLNYAGLGVSDHEGHVSPAYRSYWIAPDLNKRFIHHLMRSSIFVQGYTRLLTGIRPNSLQMSREDLMEFPILVPPPSEQAAVATFLDRETSKIDSLIAEQTRLIELLKEKRQAVISHAITKGLNPDAPMKNTGIEWLGQVPEHWAVRPLKALVQSGSSISYGIVQPGEPQVEGVPFIQTTNMTTGSFDLNDLQKTTPAIASSYPRSRLNGGEVVLGIRASIGAAHIVPIHLRGANLSRGVARISCCENLSPRYLVAYFNSEWAHQYWQLSKQGSTFNEVSIDTVKQLPVPVPPSSEQQQIADALDTHCDTLNALICEAQSAINLLQERRSALISAAVTGKIDVRNLVPKQSEAA